MVKRSITVQNTTKDANLIMPKAKSVLCLCVSMLRVRNQILNLISLAGLWLIKHKKYTARVYSYEKKIHISIMNGCLLVGLFFNFNFNFIILW